VWIADLRQSRDERLGRADSGHSRDDGDRTARFDPFSQSPLVGSRLGDRRSANRHRRALRRQHARLSRARPQHTVSVSTKYRCHRLCHLQMSLLGRWGRAAGGRGSHGALGRSPGGWTGASEARAACRQTITSSRSSAGESRRCGLLAARSSSAKRGAGRGRSFLPRTPKTRR
jgi:hypothetical protein